MNGSTVPAILGIDHVHVYVTNRTAAQHWYATVLDCHAVEEFAAWAIAQGPLTIANTSHNLHLALFERSTFTPSTVLALGVTGQSFIEWLTHLAAHELTVRVVDHDLSVSLYFEDPDHNGYEVTTYDREHVLQQITVASA